MPTTPVLAQAAASGDFLSGQFGVLVPLIAMFAIFYFLLIRPQQRRQREHQSTVSGLRRGDVVVLGSGIIGKVVRAQEGEAEIDVEIAEGVKVKVVRSTVSDVRSKTEPVKEKA